MAVIDMQLFVYLLLMSDWTLKFWLATSLRDMQLFVYLLLMSDWAL